MAGTTRSFLFSSALLAVLAGDPSVDELMAGLRAKYKQADKKYDALADEIDKEVRKALKSTPWLTEPAGAAPRSFEEHPYFVLVEQLSTAARAEITKPDPKRKAAREALVAKFPWNSRLELDLGLDGGSDRPVPAHETGFIALGDAPDPVAGFPELLTNQYLFGLQEIAGWRAGVKAGKVLSFEGRPAKKPLAVETTLPGWERIRVFLQGSRPEVPLYAMPWMTHTIHARLAERRKSSSGKPDRMDEELAFLDSKWNGFTFQVPFSKERLAVVVPVHALMTDRRGFFYRFPESAQMAQVGDLPFVSNDACVQYARAFLDQRLSNLDFVQRTSSAQAASASFQADCTYLARYRTLVDQFVRAVLCPTLRYPESMLFVDYPKDKLPTERKVGNEFDVSRKHALVVWAFVGKDPARLADWLFDRVLAEEANRFPQNVNLSAVFTTIEREKEHEMMAAIAARIAEERKGGSSAGDFEREFSPYPVYLEASGEPASDLLLHSFHELHERAAKLVQDTARAVVEKELGK
jgi:hypothetical protein